MFQHHSLSNGIDLYINPTPNFRTSLVQVFVSRPLDDLYSQYALLANVLKRGSAAYPTTIELARRWDSLYGALFRANIYKLGEHHVYEMSLELANERYLQSQESVLQEGLSTLAQMLTSPYLPQGELENSYVAQEQDNLVRAIDSIFNDKSAYSSVRCIEEMCSREPYARLELGHKDELTQITPNTLTDFYKQHFPQSKVRIVLSGDVNQHQAVELCEQSFAGLRTSNESQVKTTVDAPVGEVKVKHEEQDVNQGKLVLGYRTYTSCAATDYPALVMYNGILGAFPHSKLFVNVREKASLAYYCSSSLLPVKGLMLIRSGIAPENYAQTLEIIESQLSDIARGIISQEEFNHTRLALLNELKADEDRPQKLGRAYVERLAAGAEYSNVELKERLEQVSVADIAAVAKKVHLDTVYFLRGRE